MAILDTIDWIDVRQHYLKRMEIHKKLAELHQQQSTGAFAALALGISNGSGNYSANEHALGPKVLAMNRNADQQVFDLAGRFISLTNARDVPKLIKQAQLRYLKIGVGSEMSCMVNPRVCWVANTRTIWTHLVIKHGDNIAKANEELQYYHDDDATSEMAYSAWADIHATLDVALTRIAKLGEECAKKASVEPGGIVYLWADAIATHLYSIYH